MTTGYRFQFLPGYLGGLGEMEANAARMILALALNSKQAMVASGLVLIGDAAHPMSPVGGQGVNLALRDAIVAANHLCPVMLDGSVPTAIDEATKQIAQERLPEILASQAMQTKQAKMLFAPNSFSTRLLYRMLPMLVRSGVLPWPHRQEYLQMSNGFVTVQLYV